MINVLIVSKNELSRISLKALLCTNDIFGNIDEVSSVKDIVTKHKKINYDIIIVDVYNNFHNWILDFKASAIKKKNIKILAFIPNDFVFGVKMLMDIGAIGYITKDCTQEDLLHAILQVAEAKPYFSKELATVYFAAEINGNTNQGKEYFNLKLSKRELEIITLINKGFDNTDIAMKLDISKRTVETHKKNIYKKTKVKNNNAALVYFANHKLGMRTT